MVVEADLADRARGGRRGELIADHRGRARGIGGELVRLVRVDADRHPHLGPQRGDALGLRRFGGVARLEHDQHALEAGGLRAVDDGVEIAREGLVGEMAVAVDHGSCLADCSRSKAANAASRSARRRFFVSASAKL